MSSTTLDPQPAITLLKRIFKFGALELPDLAPNLDPVASLKLYERSHPILRTASLAEPYAQGDQLVYEVEKPPVQTKG
ncbi:MAG: PRTRC system protein C [Steroidobacteraceae bacterium]